MINELEKACVKPVYVVGIFLAGGPKAPLEATRTRPQSMTSRRGLRSGLRKLRAAEIFTTGRFKPKFLVSAVRVRAPGDCAHAKKTHLS
ncbi:hypothetical protein ElyMa_003785900 [Elysia marginata]|uniref:Uncharacterized protein n=1 Tax=Elysia marginata TaxID=1093978 RepID=A0AAV4FCA0_9GAST|nr:hypothetical protein ElyMa_003785900 [Elysia marginata]